MTLYSDTAKAQEELARKVIVSDALWPIENICGVDVAYDGDQAYGSAVVMDRTGRTVIESASSKTIAKHQYVPGLLMLREAEPILNTIKKLKKNYDLLLVDGHGLLHPRKCGLACYIGLTLDRPTIGVAKRLLCGTVRDDGFVELGGQVAGFAMSLSGKKKLFISVGHRISLNTAVAFARELGRGGIPEPLRLADANSKMQKRGKGLGC
ncbi:MAG TPA: endonuclease V [Nitrososphaera sp.]|nr:endonuclease V [Nitrososphaera sp.]